MPSNKLDSIREALEEALAIDKRDNGSDPSMYTHQLEDALATLKSMEGVTYARQGSPIQMQDVLLACGELNERERVAVQWVLDKVNALPQAVEVLEPVAWSTSTALDISKHLSGSPFETITAASRNLWGENGVPLYAHPHAPSAPPVELTEEEVERTAKDNTDYSKDHPHHFREGFKSCLRHLCSKYHLIPRKP